MSQKYSQPDFYHFSENSLCLVEEIYPFIENDSTSILDIGAGCGVIGLEILKRRVKGSLLSVDIENDYEEHYTENRAMLGFGREKAVFQTKDFLEWESPVQFDIVVSNLPFFITGQGRSCPLIKRRVAREISLENQLLWIQKMISMTVPGGIGAFLFKKSKHFFKGVEVLCDKKVPGADLIIYRRLNED